MTDDQTRKVTGLLKGERFAFLTTRTPDGTLTSRPMTLQEVEFDGDLWFFAERDSHPVRHITLSPQVNVGVTRRDSSSIASPTAPAAATSKPVNGSVTPPGAPTDTWRVA